MIRRWHAPVWGLCALGWCGIYVATDVVQAIWTAIGCSAMMVIAHLIGGTKDGD